MRTLMTMLIACVATIGIASASSKEAPAVAPASDVTAPADDGVVDESGDSAYECRYSPYCRKASQCEAYCAGGIPVCSQGCCACAS